MAKSIKNDKPFVGSNKYEIDKQVHSTFGTMRLLWWYFVWMNQEKCKEEFDTETSFQDLCLSVLSLTIVPENYKYCSFRYKTPEYVG